MSDPPEEPDPGNESGGESDAAAASGETADDREPGEDADIEALREAVEQRYDFEDFGPREMAEMSPEEWEAAFDADAWVTGTDLLDRVEADLRARVADRDVFAVVERVDGDHPRVVAYSDRSYAVVHPDGSVEGEGGVLRDVKPTVALASIPDYDVPDVPDDAGLPAPDAVGGTRSSLGNRMLQFVAAALVVSSLVLFGATVFADLGGAGIVAATTGLVFLVVGVALLFTVANARLSSRYRAEEFRDRLRGAGVEEGDRPAFLPIPDAAFEEGDVVRTGDDAGPDEKPGAASDRDEEAGADASDPDDRAPADASGADSDP